MSTRSTLTIKTDHTTINFYRHMDGYVAEAGNTLLHLLDKVVNAKNAWQHPAIKLAEEIIKGNNTKQLNIVLLHQSMN